MLRGKVMTIFLIAGLMKNISLYKMSYYPQRDSHSRNKIKFELGLSNYATKSEVEGTTGVDTSKFGRKGDLANIKSKVNQLHFNCPELTSNDFYLEETGRRTNKRLADHCDNDKESHLLRYSFNSNHKLVELKYFKIIDSSYHNNRLERKILKARYNKHYKPCLNTKEQSVQLKLLVKYLFKSRHLPTYNYFNLKDGLWKSLDQNYILNKCSILYILLYCFYKQSLIFLLSFLW